MAQVTTQANSLTSAIELFQTSVRRLLQQVRLRRWPRDIYLADATTALNALPLASGEYARILSNLQNAGAYLAVAEWGAAEFELRTSLGRLAGAFSDGQAALSTP